MRGKKGVPHTDPEDPPRRRANKAKGHGTWDTDRPPVCGVVGRASDRLSLRVGRRSGAAELVDRTVVPRTKAGATVYTDEWNGYKPLTAAGRGHATVNHNAGEWARDDDGDGSCEVQVNTRAGFGSPLRSGLRPPRGVAQEGRPMDPGVFGFLAEVRAGGQSEWGALIGLLVTPPRNPS